MSDSLGGAIYNATLSVDVNELDYLDSVTITDTSGFSINSNTATAEAYFGYQQDANGFITMLPQNDFENDTSIDKQIDDVVIKDVLNKNNIIEKIKADNPNTTKTNQELLDLYDDMNNDGFILF